MRHNCKKNIKDGYAKRSHLIAVSTIYILGYSCSDFSCVCMYTYTHTYRVLEPVSIITWYSITSPMSTYTSVCFLLKAAKYILNVIIYLCVRGKPPGFFQFCCYRQPSYEYPCMYIFTQLPDHFPRMRS